MREMRRLILGLLTCTALLMAAPYAVAAPDHLLCRDAKEAAPHASYTADVLSAAYAGTGCRVKAPAKLVCDEATVSNVTPPPPNATNLGNAGRFLCYALKCPKDVDTLNITDAFGTHTTTLKSSKLLCAPEIPPAFGTCDGPGADCNGCIAGCAVHQDASPPTNVCVNPGICNIGTCGADSECPADYACVVDPTNPPQTICCAGCP